MTDEEILASITYHMMVAGGIDHPQLQEHKRRGVCPACDRGFPAEMATANCEHRANKVTP